MSVTGEGLRVELLESEKGIFFDSGSGNPSEVGEELIAKLAEQLVKLPNQLLIEGHTDARPFNKRKDYTNWELSVDRANAARRIIEAHGARPDQIVQVRGFADQNLRNRDNPEDASNRRISVIVRYQNATAVEEPPDPSEPVKTDGKTPGKDSGKAASSPPAPASGKAPETPAKAPETQAKPAK